jgi:hypothetical protein
MTYTAEAPNKSSVRRVLREWLPAIGVSLGTAFLIVLPFFSLGTASGHDIAFHASSWLDAAEQWKEGIFYPRWTERANYGFGEPRFIFYPPLSWMLGAALGFVVPWNAVPGVFIVVIQMLAGVSMFALARRFFSAGAALFGAASYAANPYALLIVYMRSDFSEQLACALMPVLLLAALQLCGLLENRWQSSSRVVTIFAVLFAAVWLCNAPAGVMASYSMVLLFAWAAIGEKSLRPLIRGTASLALGFGLAGFYLLPAAYEQRWVNIAQALSFGLLPSQNFLYTLIDDPEHNQFNWIASSVAVLLMVMTGIAALVGYRSMEREEAHETKEKVWRAMLLLSAAAAFLMLRPSSILWTLLPKLRFLQFPWRWMAILAVAYSYFGAGALTRKRGAWIWSVVVVLASGGTATFLVRTAWWDSDDIPTLQEAIANDQGFEGSDEYDPVGDDRTDLPQKAPIVQILPSGAPAQAQPKAEIRIDRWTAEEKKLSVTSSRPLRLSLRLLNYPAWRVEVDGQAVTPQPPEATAQMIVPLSAGTHRITVSFARTRDRTLGGVISAGAGIALLALFCSRGPKRQPQNP